MKTNAERVKATSLRRKVAAGQPLTEEQEAWLREYETTRTQQRARRRDSDSSSGSPPASGSSSSSGALLSVPDVTTAPAAAAVPMLPPAPPPEGAPSSSPSPSGQTAPPADEPVVATAAPGPTEAELAAGADKLAVGVVALATFGLGAALELAPEDLPFRAELGSEEVQRRLLEYVAGAARRVAMKYGVTVSLPYEDELVVLAAVGGSVAALVTVQRRKREASVGPMTDAARVAKRVEVVQDPPPSSEASAAYATGWAEVLGAK